MRNTKIKKNIKSILFHTFVIIVGFIMIYPVLWMISGSFKDNSEILRKSLSLIPKNFKLSNYITGWKGFSGISFGRFFLNSFVITSVATLGTVVSSSLVAYAFARINFIGRKFWFTCMLITMMLPGDRLL